MFSEKVCDEIGYYVYRLVDPRSQETFYVGKGTGNRVFQHIEERITDELDSPNLKLQIISDIKKSGLDVQHIIHRHNLSEKEAFHVEAALIDAYGESLSNVMGGYKSNDSGPMRAEQIIEKYDLPELIANKNHKLLLLNINRTFDLKDEKELYNLTRFSWKLSKSRAEECDYVLSVVRGVIKAVFVADKWLPATKDNFSDITHVREFDPQRYGFIGHRAPDDIWGYYVGDIGKRIKVINMKHNQNPVKYYP